MTTYPHGYGTNRLTLDELKKRHNPRLHPAFARRFWPWLESMGGVIGVGSGWRTNPHPVSAASRRGHSFHQDQDFDSGTFYSAFDLVQENPSGGGHVMVDYRIVPLQGSAEAEKWGVHINIGTPGKRGFEPWHMQPVELDGYASWENAGRPDLDPDYPIPGGSAPAPLPAPPVHGPKTTPYDPWPSKDKPNLGPLPHRSGRENRDAVRYLQTILRDKAAQHVTVDGWFGPQTELAVRHLQKFFGLTVDGWVGKQTWPLVDALARS